MKKQHFCYLFWPIFKKKTVTYLKKIWVEFVGNSNCWPLGEKRRRGQQWFWVGGYIYDHTKQGSTHLIKMHIIIRNLFVKRCCHCCNWTWTTYFWIFLSCSYVYTYYCHLKKNHTWHACLFFGILFWEAHHWLDSSVNRI